MPKHPLPGAVLFARDAPRVAAFYASLVPMQITHAGADLIVLQSPGQQLMVHPIAAPRARTGSRSTAPTRRAAAAVKLVFGVHSIEDVRARVQALGGALDPPQRMFEAHGFRACDGQDPEGNVVQFRETVVPRRPAAARPAARGKGLDFDTVRAVALAVPQVVDRSTLRGLAFKVHGKLLACKAFHRSAEPQSLMVRVGARERDRLLATEPATYYLTPHYQDYEVVLVRLPRMDRKRLEALLARACEWVSATAAGRRS